MKYLKAFTCVLLIALLLSGCSFRISSSVEELIAPISPFGDNAVVKEALDRFVPAGYSLKTPRYGSNISSYNFYDIDGDGKEEAVAFYEPSDALGSVNLAVIQRGDKEWKVVCNIAGFGKDVYSLDFARLNGDKRTELVVCWDAISNSQTHELAVYSYRESKGEATLKQTGETLTVNTCYIVDMFRDGEDKLMLFNLNSGSTASPRVALYALRNDRLENLGETKLDSRIASFISIKSEEEDGRVHVYADAATSDSSVVITEFIYWSKDYDSLDSPFYNYSTARNTATERSVLLPSMDVDGNGVSEIPIDYRMRKLPKQVKAVEFTNVKYSTLIHNSYALVCAEDKYVYLLPEGSAGNISVFYDKNTRAMTLKNKETKNEIVTLMPALSATYSAEKYPSFTKIYEASGYCYLARIGNDSALKPSEDAVKNSIKIID